MLKVLIVEDNPVVMDLLREAVAPLASVSSATDAADALLRTVEDTPDLIVADYAMPGMDGLQLLEKLKARPATAKTPVILMAPKADILERLKPFEEDVADFLAKPFFVKDAVIRIRRVLGRVTLEKASHAPSDTLVRGSLAQMNVIDLLQSLDMGRKTCLLTLMNGDDGCMMYFSEGQLVHAVAEHLIGDQAVYKALTWAADAGTFEIDFEQRASQQTTTRTTQGLLMEGLRLLDEANRE